MKYHYKDLLIALVILLVCIAGCTSTAPSISQTTPSQPIISAQPATPIPTPEINLSTIELSEMALQLSELPAGFIIIERSERTTSDVMKDALDNGWKKGYIVKFRYDLNKFEGTEIFQSISVYPIENMDKVLSYQKNEVTRYFANKTASGSVIIDDLSNPNIGDQSQAYRVTDTKDNLKYYVIDFVKKDVFEEIRMFGTITDYENLKELARIAAAKIK